MCAYFTHGLYAIEYKAQLSLHAPQWVIPRSDHESVFLGLYLSYFDGIKADQ